VTRASRRIADEQLAAELAAGKTIREAAAAAGVSLRTAKRRLNEPEFKKRIMDVRAAAVANATAIVFSGMNEAASVLKQLVSHKDPRIQERAAVKVIELGMKLNAVTELERRLEQLEQFLAIQFPCPVGPKGVHNDSKD
jgi:hypothetical protein